MTAEQTLTSEQQINLRQEAKVRMPIHPESDVTYNRLRENIRGRFKSLVDQGTPIVSVSGGVYDGFDIFSAQISDDDQKHYDCKCCRAFFSNAGGLAYLNDKFQLVNVLSEVFSETFGIGEPLLVSARDINTTVTVGLTKAIKNTWDHFYAFTPEEAQNLNDLSGVDFEFAKAFSVTALSTNIGVLEKVLAYLNEALYKPESVGLLKPFIKLMNDYNKAAKQEVSVISIYHAISIMGRTPGYSWVKGLHSSLSGVVLDSINTTGVLDKGEVSSVALKLLANFINEKTDPLVYKRAVAEASTQALARDVQKLTELNVPRFLERKRATKEDLNVIWQEVVKEDPVAGVKEGASATELALAKVLKSKEFVDPTFAFSKLLKATPIQKSISLESFIRKLSTFTAISYDYHLATGCTFTKPVDGADYSVVSSKRDGIFPRHLSSPSNISKWGRVHIPSIIKFDTSPGKSDYIMEMSGFKEDVENVLKHTGTCVLGSDIKSELYGHARGWTELSKSIEMQETDGKPFYGAGIAKGSVLTVLTTDGVAISYTITSLD